MCLIVTVDLGDAEAGAAHHLVAMLSGDIAPFSMTDEPGVDTHGIRISAHGCDLLSEDADWDAPTWSMTPDAIAELERVWQVVFASTDGDIVLTAIWSDDDPTAEVALSRASFIQLTRASLIGTHTRYRITPTAAIQG